MANYQFVDWFGLTIRYSHEDLDVSMMETQTALHLALLFTITNNFVFECRI